MKWDVLQYQDKWFVHVVLELDGHTVAFTRRVGYAAKADAKEAMLKCWRATLKAEDKLQLFNNSEIWASRSPFDPEKTVHVDEHWRRPPIRKMALKLRVV